MAQVVTDPAAAATPSAAATPALRLPAGSAALSSLPSSTEVSMMGPSSTARLEALPREILQQILSELPWRSVISCTHVSRALYEACDSSLLWRGLCLDEYASWHEDHLLEERLGIREPVIITSGGGGGLSDVFGTGTGQQEDGGGSLGEVGGRERRASTALDTDWKQLFAERKLQDKMFARAFDRVLSRQDGRIDAVAQITARGEDARDLMERYRRVGNVDGDYIKHNNNNDGRNNGNEEEEEEGREKEDDDNDDDDDSLARSYWANEILGSINRAQALQEITNVLTATSRLRRPGRAQQQDYPLIKALWAIDYFVAESPPETLPQMLTHLDNIAAAFRAEYPTCFAGSGSGNNGIGGGGGGGTSRRQRALCLAEFVRAHDLVGVRSPETYHDLQNSLVSVALCERDHPALPLISHAIYCALAERVGLVAGLTNTPRHVYVTVKAPDGASLDDEMIDDDENDTRHGSTPNTTSPAQETAASAADVKDDFDPSRTMFLDPFHHEGEVPLAQLRSLYAGVGMARGGGGGVGGLLGFASLLQNDNHHPVAADGGPLPAQVAAALRPASTRDMMFRMARNLQETLRGGAHSLAYTTALEDPTDEFVGHLTSSSVSPLSLRSPEQNPSYYSPAPRGGGGGGIKPTILNPYRAGYCAWWLQTLLDDIGGPQHRALYNFVEGFMHHFKETDCPLVTGYMLAAFSRGAVASPGAGGGEDVFGAADAGRDEAAFVETVLAHVRREDGRVKTAKRRDVVVGRGSTAGGGDGGGSGSGSGGVHAASPIATAAAGLASSDTAREDAAAPREQEPPRDWQVRYRVGDLFRHRRYGYRAVITGWDATCQASEQWMQQMGVDALPGGGRSQSFYHVLVEDHSTRYVAQENIDVIVPRRRRRRRHRDSGGGGEREEGEEERTGDDNVEEEAESPDHGPPVDILRIAGRYFKRWDASVGRFVSNVRDEYPDD
ncbi:hypothetical protein Micbo1qcDRAFT_222406 [Microdochium bolleyi]|uniref:F-box domain-containing protein n=1 Tax=Microdochium bolleyi TaxID=196109 RepID=A0A136J6A2_9PEZI|nr:hypothetical protein Micbo1qcDRAFT_222406 [Microdochium bolleyi]